MECKICGRTEEELEEEFGREVPVKEHQGMLKCRKCVREYQRMSTGGTDDEEEETTSSGDWKDALTA